MNAPAAAEEDTQPEIDLNSIMMSMLMMNLDTVQPRMIGTKTLAEVQHNGKITVLQISVAWLRRTNHDRHLWEELFHRVSERGAHVVVCFTHLDPRFHWKLQTTASDLLRLHGGEPAIFFIPKDGLTSLGLATDDPNHNTAIDIRDGQVIRHTDLTPELTKKAPERLSA